MSLRRAPRRWLTTASLAALTLASATVLYMVNLSTRRLEQRVLAEERRLERLESDIAILRAERAYLARPERIEAHARRQGLGPIEPGQYARFGDLAPPSAPLQRPESRP